MTLPDHGASSTSDALARFLDDPCMSSVLLSVADICLVTTSEGEVLVASAREGSTLESLAPHWPGQAMSSLIDASSAQKLAKRLADIAANGSDGAARWAELAHVTADKDVVPVRYSMHPMRAQSHILMMGQDQRPTIEMQQMLLNAQIALERDHEAQREIDTRYRLLMDFSTDAIALLSIGSGLIVDINHNAANILGRARADLVERPFAECFQGQTREAIVSALEAPQPAGSDVVMDVEVKSTGRTVQLTGKLFRASGEQLAIVRLTDPERGSVGDERLVGNLRQLFNHGSDAIVFSDRDGNILAASETFLNLTDSPSAASVRGRSLSEFLARGVVDLRVLLDNARRAGQLRMYASKLNTSFGAQVGVEISATWLDDKFDPVLALVIRNATSASNVRPEAGGQDSNMQGVIELVGSSTLKDIVSETTDVIEKICIETALELTRNNRVAAAEMLGLSRQSLYVKLRKFDLLSKDEN
ncbi:MAG: transcriptional regulator PpsR [Natronohydrobacter sp.]|nr:transcriptional regulator PpsR [Natronohydrobacter sp.]